MGCVEVRGMVYGMCGGEGCAVGCVEVRGCAMGCVEVRGMVWGVWREEVSYGNRY